MKLLICLDGSAAALEAVRHVVRNRDRYRERPEIHLLNVQLPVASGLVNRFVPQGAIDDYHREEGLKVLAEAGPLLDDAGLVYHCHVGVGHAAETIVAHALAQGCDEIVMTTRGLGGVRGLVLGSTARRVVELTQMPVLLIKARAES